MWGKQQGGIFFCWRVICTQSPRPITRQQQGGIFFCWRVIGLGLWVQIGTADGGKCFAVDAALSTVGVVLCGGCKSLDTRRTPFPLLVADGLQWKGERGSTDYVGYYIYIINELGLATALAGS